MAENNGLSRRKFEFLEQLSTEDLEDLLCLSSDSEELEGFADAIIEVIVRRERAHPTGRIPNVDDAWSEFQALYNTPEKLGQTKKNNSSLTYSHSFTGEKKTSSMRAVPRPRHAWHIAATAVIAVMVTLVSMIGVQAAGLNVFGALAQWTDEFFHYVPSPTENNLARDSLRNQGIPEELSPTWIPERFEFQSVDSYSNDQGNFATIEYASEDGSLCIEISQFNSSTYLVSWDYQKDSDGVEVFISHQREFYIISNLEITIATWSDGQTLAINIWGDVSSDEMMDIISSIGG